MKLALVILAIAAPAALAQSSATPACATLALAAFDVASVKPSNRPSGSSSMHGRPDSLTAGGTALSMIEYAYNLHDFQISGGPGWLNSATWEITAKVDQPPAGYDSLSSSARSAIQSQRMQAVLAERFALRCHFEMKELPVYNLVIAKGGPKLKPTPPDATRKGSLDETTNKSGANLMEANGVSLDMLAADLIWPLGRKVIDKTGLTGIYDFTLTYTSDTSSDAASAPTIFTALEEQLGLRLESAKGPIPVLVIDSIDRPSEN